MDLEQTSTSMALREFKEEIISCIDKKKYGVGLFMDKKQFDTNNHEILFSKVEKYSIRGVVLNWLKSYIGNKQQFIQIGDYKSTFIDLLVEYQKGQY